MALLQNTYPFFFVASGEFGTHLTHCGKMSYMKSVGLGSEVFTITTNDDETPSISELQVIKEHVKYYHECVICKTKNVENYTKQITTLFNKYMARAGGRKEGKEV